jgi:hypothetical protein
MVRQYRCQGAVTHFMAQFCVFDRSLPGLSSPPPAIRPVQSHVSLHCRSAGRRCGGHRRLGLHGHPLAPHVLFYLARGDECRLSWTTTSSQSTDLFWKLVPTKAEQTTGIAGTERNSPVAQTGLLQRPPSQQLSSTLDVTLAPRRSGSRHNAATAVSSDHGQSGIAVALEQFLPS